MLLHLEQGSPWVYGMLANNVWVLSKDREGGKYNDGLVHPFVN